MIMSVTSWLWLVLLLLILVLIYRHLTRNFKHWKEQLVPYITPLPLFGNMFKLVTLKQSLGQFAKDVYNSSDSKVIGFFVFDQPFLLIRDLALLKQILIKDFHHFDNRSINSNQNADEISSNLLFILKNPEWKPLRMKLTPAFSSGKIKSMLHLLLEASEDLRKYVQLKVMTGNRVIEGREMCMKYTTDVITSCAFGINAESLKNEDAALRFVSRNSFSWSISRSIQMAAYFVAPCLANLFRMKFIDSKLSDLIRSVFWKHMKQRKLSQRRRGDLVDILLRMKEGNNKGLDGEVLVAQALQFFIAGFETTGNTISFALYELAVNKSVQTRLREEIRKTLTAHGGMTYEAIMDMKYLDNIVSETLRKYPSLTFLDRRCSKDYTIPGSDVVIHKGMPVYISLLGLQMDANYFPEPDKFNPDRFSDENKGSIPPFAYLPFGEGPRNCIGARFGLLSAKSALITVFQNFEVDLHSTTPVPLKLDPKSGFLIAPEGGIIYLRFKCIEESC